MREHAETLEAIEREIAMTETGLREALARLAEQRGRVARATGLTTERAKASRELLAQMEKGFASRATHCEHLKELLQVARTLGH